MYKYTDKVIRKLDRRIVEIFAFGNRLIRQDELNVLQKSKSMYQKLEDSAEEGLLEIAQEAYRQGHRRAAVLLGIHEPSERTVSKSWLKDQLEEYDPITGYVFLHEVKRKRDRFAESVIAQKNHESVRKARNLWAAMVGQYAIEVTDRAAMQAYKDDGVKFVRWNTEEDDRVCKTCKARNGKVYPIDAVPEKPHYHCRCYFTPTEKS